MCLISLHLFFLSYLIATAFALTCKSSATVKCCKPKTQNCDLSGFIYIPIRCKGKEDCSCKTGGKANCGQCPDDRGSQWKETKVCFCSGVFAADTGAENECHPAKPFGPQKSAQKSLQSPAGEKKDDPPSSGVGDSDGDKQSGEEKASLPVAALVGGATAGTALLVLLGCCIYFRLCRARRLNSTSANSNSSSSKLHTSHSASKSNYVPFTPPDVPPTTAAHDSWREAPDAEAGSAAGLTSLESTADTYASARGYPPLPESPPPVEGEEGESWRESTSGSTGEYEIMPPPTPFVGSYGQWQ